MMIAHPYYRFSHTDQRVGSSIARQREDTNTHIASKSWLLDDEYIDEAKSATKARHRQEGAELHRFEVEARSGVHHGKVLVVEKLDRLSRRGHDDTYDLIKSLGRCGVHIATVDGDRYVVVPNRSALVLRIFHMADASDGALTIAKKLNSEGVPVWQRWAKRPVRVWDHTRIRKILADEAVLGWRKGKGDPIRIYPQVVPSDLFERVRANAPVRAETKGGANSAVVANLVSGLARCDVCGSTMDYDRKRTAGKPYQTRPAGNIAYLKHDSASLVCRAALNGGCRNRSGITAASSYEAVPCVSSALGDQGGQPVNVARRAQHDRYPSEIMVLKVTEQVEGFALLFANVDLSAAEARRSAAEMAPVPSDAAGQKPVEQGLVGWISTLP